MSSLIQYRSLFSVKLLHEYYLPLDPTLFQGIPTEQQDLIAERQKRDYRVSRDFDLAPTNDCRTILENLRFIFKQNNFGFNVACQANAMGDGTFVPFTPLDDAFNLRFTLDLKNSQIYNFTNLQLGKNVENRDRYIYYFSNRTNNFSSPDLCYLSRPMAVFDNTSAYEAGEIILDLSDLSNPVILEALEDNGPGSFNSSLWQQILADIDPLPQFVTREDLIMLRPCIFKHQVESAGSENLVFLIRDRDGAIQRTLNFQTTESGTPLVECELNLSGLPYAYYILEVRDSVGTVFADLGFPFYLDDQLYNQHPFGLIECFFEPDDSLGEYGWLDQDNENRLLSPIYIVRWKNRSTFWRYYFSDAPSFTSSQVTVYEQPPGSPIDRILVSNQPLGLTQFSRQLEIEIGGDTYFLPNPDVVTIYPENNRLYSEINMGGGLGPP